MARLSTARARRALAVTVVLACCATAGAGTPPAAAPEARVSMGPAAAGPAPAAATDPSRLTSGQRLGAGQGTSGQRLASPSAAYVLVVQGDGNVVVYAQPGRALWSTGTHGNPGAAVSLVLQDDGNLVAYDTTAAPRALWQAGTRVGPGATLSLQDDGNLVLYAAGGVPVWSTGPDRGTQPPPPPSPPAPVPAATADRLAPGAQLAPGQRLTSRDGSHHLVMQGDGNVVAYAPGGRALWSTRTTAAGTRLLLQTDGNLVAYDPAGRARWSTGTQGNPGTVAVLQDDGNLVLYRADGAPAWNRGVFRATAHPVSAADLPYSYRSGCPVGPASLRRLEVSYLDYAGASRTGNLVVHADTVPALTRTFARAYAEGFGVRTMVPVDAYRAVDEASMADGNTSAFNCRAVVGNPLRLSQHSYGNAIDINTFENPYVTGSTVYPPGSGTYLDRRTVRPGMHVPGTAILEQLRSEGWAWGGRWSPPDYHHFSSNGG